MKLSPPPDHRAAAAGETRPSHLWLAMGLLVTITLWMFWPAKGYEFLFFDDPVYVTENTHVLRGLTWDNVRWAFTNLDAAFWQPLTWLSYMLDVTLFGKSAGAMHFTNLLLHIVSTVLLFVVLRRLTGALWRSAIVAALFALHPLHVESVAWIAERKDVLSTVFWMLTMLFYVRYAEARTRSLPNALRPAPRASWNYSLALFFFLCGLMSKTMVVTLPVVMLLLDYWPLKRFSLEPGAPRLAPFLRLVAEKTPFFILGFLAGLLTIYAEKQGGAVTGTEHLPITIRVANAAISGVTYLVQIFYPANLAPFYPYPKTFWLFTVLGAWLVVLVLSVVALWLGRRRPYLLFGWLWYLVTLSLVSGLIQVGGHVRADRYTYVPLIGIFIILVWGAAELLARWRVSRTATGVLTAVVVSICAFLGRQQLGYWHDNEKLFLHTIAVTKNNDIAYNNLGEMYVNQKRYAEAATCFETALQINPDSAEAHNNFGVVLLNDGKYAEALKQFRETLRETSDSPQAHGNIGNILNLRHDYTNAISEYEAALRLKPDYTMAHNNLGAAYELTGRRPEALAQYRLALEFDPEYPDAHKNLGMILVQMGNYPEAIPHMRLAVQHWPGDGRLFYNLAVALAGTGQFSEASTNFAVGVRGMPADGLAHFNYGTVLARLGRLEEAIEQYRLAVAAQPDFGQAHNELGVALARKKQFDEAITHFKAALSNNPNIAEIHYNLGKALLEQNKTNEAVGQFQEVLRLTPADPDATEQLRRLNQPPSK